MARLRTKLAAGGVAAATAIGGATLVTTQATGRCGGGMSKLEYRHSVFLRDCKSLGGTVVIHKRKRSTRHPNPGTIEVCEGGAQTDSKLIFVNLPRGEEYRALFTAVINGKEL